MIFKVSGDLICEKETMLGSVASTGDGTMVDENDLGLSIARLYFHKIY